MHKMKQRLLARTAYGVLAAVAGYSFLIPSAEAFVGQRGERYPMYPARQQQATPAYQAAPARPYNTAQAPAYRPNIQPYYGGDAAPLYPERCAGSEVESVFEFPAMEQEPAPAPAPVQAQLPAPYPPAEAYPPVASPYAQPETYAPAYPNPEAMVDASAEYRPYEAPAPAYAPNYQAAAPRDEMPVFRAYNTIETDRRMAFDRARAASEAAGNRAPEYGYQQPRAPQAPAPSYQRQPIEEPSQSYAPQPQSSYSPAPASPRYSAAPAYSEERYSRAPRYSPAPAQSPAPEYREHHFGYDEPAPQSPPPNREYRSAAQYYGQLQQEAEQALQPLEEMDARNQAYDPRDFPSYSPAYPGGASYPPTKRAEAAEPAYPSQRPVSANRDPHSYAPPPPAPRAAAGYAPQPYVPAVSQPYFERLPRLSSKTQDILNRLPKNIDSEAKTAGRKVDLERFSPDTTSALGADPEGNKDNKASVETKAPGYNADIELERAYEALMAGQSATAIDIYREILQRDKRNQDALFGLATTYHRMGNLQSALPVYGQLLKINPEHREALNNFLVLVSEESAVDALRELEQLEQKNPDFSPIPAQLAILYDNLGQPDAARKKMMRAINLEPDNLVYKYNLAIMLDKQGKSRDAASLYRELMEASRKGKALPADAKNIEERLAYLSSQGA